MTLATPTLLTADGSGINDTVFTTASISPTAGGVILAAISEAIISGGDPEQPTLSGVSATWR